MCRNNVCEIVIHILYNNGVFIQERHVRKERGRCSQIVL